MPESTATCLVIYRQAYEVRDLSRDLSTARPSSGTPLAQVGSGAQPLHAAELLVGRTLRLSDLGCDSAGSASNRNRGWQAKKTFAKPQLVGNREYRFDHRPVLNTLVLQLCGPGFGDAPDRRT